MEFNKKTESFEMFGLTFEIRKDKRTKYRIIFCQNKLIVGVETFLAHPKVCKNWGKEEIVNSFSEKCKRQKMGKNEILRFISTCP